MRNEQANALVQEFKNRAAAHAIPEAMVVYAKIYKDLDPGREVTRVERLDLTQRLIDPQTSTEVTAIQMARRDLEML